MGQTKTKKIIAGLGGGLILVGGGAVVTDSQINPYTTVGTKLEIMATSTLSEGGKTKLIAEKTEPKITLEKWNGEVKMGVKYTGMTASGDRPFLSKNVEWSDANQKMEAVPLSPSPQIGEDGGMEINIILNSKPASNVFTFQLDNWENLDFFYQAPLWQEEGLKAPTKNCNDIQCGVSNIGTTSPLVVRDATVVGSYAVYYKNHANHKIGSTNYATGKAYHIYRPLVTDNSGQTTWADLSYSNGVLNVTVPQAFLNTASYPVTVDPTFGYTAAGATESNVNSVTKGSLVLTYTANSGDTVTNISAYERCNNSANGYGADAATYTIDGTPLPVTRLGSQHALQNIAMSSQTLIVLITPVTDVMSAGTTYGVAWTQDGPISCSVNAVLYSDTTSGVQASTAASPGAALPSTWSSSGTTAVKYSVFATFTAGPTAYSSSATLNNSSTVINKSNVVIP